ncbi:MAG: hypothetical protein COV74_08755 [Candidatus Omnitrophica bacterium CG11_big_fil_rev_8_21_14_0_20_45_26]|uniref:DUF5666 domain-containing protein n=1 Tax=Candidatus Abzuiibacterium crystallinum TaxID=1974748 RepID=A0A2H0LMD2_9BACT|nr:MAG: hypothetical protein COV74_08755 [Candidatus Omnitrophica bacterium CG11_big_fil_rev_8_21_14_0_20_45_26]PIW63750.1 MAG: hypothetical protein COW12_09640 [Candidatus Omnitrophica bacterium CG12_big_fil_rev_8_21_14_0_65_45_16]
MKKFKLIALTLLLVLVALQTAAMAETIEGKVASVNAETSEIEVIANGDSYWVAYDSSTKWPEGVTKPDELVDSMVKIDADDISYIASSVEKM